MQERDNVTSIRPIRKRKKKTPVVGLGLFLLFCLSLSSYFFINSAFFNLKEIKVSGCSTVSEDKLVELSGLTLGTNLFKIDVQGAVTKTEMHPVVKSVTISRKVPHTIVLDVTERTPVALVVGIDGYLAVDTEGIYVKKVQDLLNIKLPIISGNVVEESTSPGTDVSNPGLNAALELVRLMDVSFLENVTEIKAASPQSMTLKMLQGVEIRFGEPEDIERKLQIIRELLFDNEEVVNNQTVEYIDLRYNSLPVIKRKK